MSSATQFSRHRVIKALNQGIKSVLRHRGIQTSTRAGNQELRRLLKPLTAVTYPSLAAATAAGEALGQAIADLSQQRGKTHLDRGVIRQLAMSPGRQGITAEPQAAPTATTLKTAAIGPEPTPEPASAAPLARDLEEPVPAPATAAAVSPPVPESAAATPVSDPEELADTSTASTTAEEPADAEPKAEAEVPPIPATSSQAAPPAG